MKGNISVLLVDDDRDMLETQADILEASGFDVDTAAHGEEAEKKFRSRTYDVAVVDIMLPGIKGVELVRKLKPAYPGTCFLLVTGYAGTQLAQNAVAEKSVQVLYKPIDPDKFIAAIRQLATTGKDCK